MDIISQSFHIGEFFVGANLTGFRVALAMPAVINIYVGPAIIDEAFSTIALALWRTFSSVTEHPQQFQLFQPIGGVRQILSPTSMRRVRSAMPRLFLAVSLTL